MSKADINPVTNSAANNTREHVEQLNRTILQSMSAELEQIEEYRKSARLAEENAATVCDEHKQISDRVILNLNEQMRLLQDERDTLKRICKTTELTCSNQQQELQMLRQQQHALIPESRAVAKLRHEFGSTNNANKATIVELQRQLREQKLQCDRLEEDKAHAQKRLAEIETTYRAFLAEQAESTSRAKHTEVTLQTAKVHIAATLRQRAEMQRRLTRASAALKEHVQRETRALEKIQEVLLVADAAIAERNSAHQREQDVKEECEHLATTIGQVIQEATAKCEQDIEQRHARYTETVQTLEAHIVQLNTSLQLHMTQATQAGDRVDALEQRIQCLLQTKARLDAELEMASKTIIEMEVHTKELDQLLTTERDANRLHEESFTEMAAFLDSLRKLNLQWRTELTECSNKYEAICMENGTLKAENHQLRAKLARQQQQEQQAHYGNNVLYMTVAGGSGDGDDIS